MPNPPSRRTVLRLSGLALASVTGCLGGLSDLQYSNRTEREVVVTTTVTRDANGKTVFSDTTTIPAEESASYRDPIAGEELFLIRVSVENGPEDTYEWNLPDSNAYGLSIRITQDAIEFQRMAT